jgi:hypothetical protein
MITSPPSTEVQTWSIDKLVFYARNPRKNDAAVDRMCSSIREFGFKIPVLVRSNGEVVDGHYPCRTCGARADVIHIPTDHLGYYCEECCLTCNRTSAARG